MEVSEERSEQEPIQTFSSLATLVEIEFKTLLNASGF